MKKLNQFLLLFILVTASFLNSCTTDVEPLDPAINTGQCFAPTFFQASDFINETSVNLSWVPNGGAATWEVKYGPAGFSVSSGTSVLSNDTNLTINDLQSQNNYEFYVRTICDENFSSSWVGPITVNSSVSGCIKPTGLTAVRSTATPTDVMVTWSAAGTETSWEISYGAQGFAPASGTIVNSTTLSKLISGVNANSSFDFYVRAICSPTEKSSWAGPFLLTGGNTPPVSYGYMSATINGQSFSNMKPFFYPIAGGAYAFINSLMYGPDALQIQGNTAPLDPQQQNNYEINLVIPRNLWLPGTYVLDPNTSFNDEGPIPTCLMNLIIPLGGPSIALETTGSITITEFNITTRRVKGTFNFSYMENNTDTGAEAGPFQVTNGTFDFPIDPADDID